MLYQIKDGTVSAGGQTILSHVDFYIKEKEKIAVVGKTEQERPHCFGFLRGSCSLTAMTIAVCRQEHMAKRLPAKIVLES